MKLLVVDDEQAILNTLKTNFDLEGYDVHTCQDPLLAVEEMRKHFFDIVITDIRMPDMDGVKLISEMKKIHPICQIIVVTGYSSLNYVIETLEKGVVDYFTKPFDVQMLMDTVNGLKTKIKRWKKTCALSK
jgi:YesN/AraC family two-component response regulator